jgi:Ca-activated chloride channel homolog
MRSTRSALCTSVAVVSLAACGALAGCAGFASEEPRLVAGSGTSYGGSPSGAGAPSNAPTAAPGGPAPAMMPANSGDRYKAPGTNPFVVTKHDPFSTFGVDVDTASYDIFRRDVNLGGLPLPDSVRLEEYVNSFSYNYPAPDATDRAPFRVALAAAGQVFDRPSLLFRVGVKGRQPPAQERRPANLVFLVDVSGSMDAPDKLPLVQRTLVEALEFLAPTDKISIVTYAGSTSVRLPPTPVAERATIANVIKGLTSGGGTAGGAGLNLAYAQATAGFIPEGINHILICTDGDFNLGISSTKELVELVRSKRKSGVTLTMLGYGVGNLNDDLMESVSNAGNGIYGVISNDNQMRRYVHERLLSTITHIAKDVKIQVEFNPERVLAYRLLGYENRAINDQDFRNDGIDAGEIGAGHAVTALYELVLAGGMIPTRLDAPAARDGQPVDLPREIQPADLALVKVRWKTIDATDATPAEELNAVLPANDVTESIASADADLRWAAALAGFAEILKKSPFAEPAQIETIRRIVTAASQGDADRREFAELFAAAAPRLR